MLSKLTKILSSIIAIALVLIQVDQSSALGTYLGQDRDRSLSIPLLHNNKAFLSNSNLRISSTVTGTLEDYWEQIYPPQSPDARYIHGMAYDINRNVMVVFGGDPDGKGHVRLDDTWEYDGSDWNEVSPELTPPGRVNIDHAMVYDQARGKTVLFGGLSQTGHLDDTWEYYREGAIRIWEPITPTIKPLVRDSQAMAYDSTRHLTVMYGGWSPIEPGYYLQDTWEYDGNNWQNIETQNSPPARHQHALAYDSKRDVVVLFGGRDTPTTTLNDTWEYDGTNWYQVSTATSPSPRSSHGMAYDSIREVIVLFGGRDGDGNPLNHDTWEYDGTNWVQISTTVSPSERYGTPLVFDSQKEKMVLFGGGLMNGNFHTSDETWEYTGDSGAVSPIVISARADIGMPYNTDRGCSSPYSGCGGSYHGFYAGVCTDIVMDAYNYNSDIPFDIQSSLYQDHLNNPGRYRYGTARYADDMRRYFDYEQEIVPKTEPYNPGDIAFFDWDGDGLSDQSGVISQTDDSGNPLAMVDATGYYSENPSGRAIELNWNAYFTTHVLEHGRVDTITPTAPLLPTYTGPALRVRLESDSVKIRLWDANGKSISDFYEENFVASNVDEFIPYIPGGYYSDLGAQKVITVTNPLSGPDYFLELSAEETHTYIIHIELIEDSSITDSDTYAQSINIGETHQIPLTLNIPAGNVYSIAPTLSPSIGTTTHLEITGFPDTTVQISTSIAELGDQPINNTHISATNLTNQMGGMINAANISISPNNFDILPAETKEVTVQVDLTGISLGVYQGSLQVTSDNGYPVSIPLTVWVQNHSIYLPMITRQ